MGCDIHVHTEVKIDGVWHHWGHPNIGRMYALFGKMAGVRSSEFEPIAEPRGLPLDATFMTMFDYHRMEGDAHTASWLGGAEIEQLGEWWEKHRDEHGKHPFIESEFGYLFSNGWNVQRYPNDYPKGVEDARWVFWFDC